MGGRRKESERLSPEGLFARYRKGGGRERLDVLLKDVVVSSAGAS